MFQPQDKSMLVWDFWITYHENKYHMHYLTDKIRKKPSYRHANAKIGYANSPDLKNWKDYGIVFIPSKDKLAWDSRATWTGSTIVLKESIDNYKFALFYTSHSLAVEGYHQKIGLALSNDWINWHRYKDNPIIIPDTNLYHINNPLAPNETAWRDPKVIFDERSQEFLAFITAERKEITDWQSGTIALASSKNLKDWEIHKPIVEQFPTPQMEVPRILQIKDKYLLIVSTSYEALKNNTIKGINPVFVFISDDLRKEFKYSQTLYCTKTPDHLEKEPILYTPEFVKHNDKWVMLAWQGINEENRFSNKITDPIDIHIDENYKISLDEHNKNVKLINKYRYALNM